jgi:hypothetical protein
VEERARKFGASDENFFSFKELFVKTGVNDDIYLDFLYNFY